MLVDSLAMLKKEIDEQMHSYLEAGGVIPGWRLKAKAKQRQWVDPDVVNNELTKLGFGRGRDLAARTANLPVCRRDGQENRRHNSRERCE